MARPLEHAIRTFSGRLMWPLDPHRDDVVIVDIAHALSNICRFTGHTTAFYSVAQHSVLVADQLLAIDPTTAFYGLLHDASEAYLTDIARPVKYQPVLEPYRAAEARLQRCIYDAFGLRWDEPELVKAADDRLLHAELRDLMRGADPKHRALAGDIPEIVPCSNWGAEAQFLEAFGRLSRLVGSAVPA